MSGHRSQRAVMYSISSLRSFSSFLDAALDHVADADDADQSTGLHHRDVTEAVLGHQVHDRLQVVAGGAHLDLGGHDRGHRVVQQLGVEDAEPLHDVPLGDDALDGHAVRGNHEGPDPVVATISARMNNVGSPIMTS